MLIVACLLQEPFRHIHEVCPKDCWRSEDGKGGSNGLMGDDDGGYDAYGYGYWYDYGGYWYDDDFDWGSIFGNGGEDPVEPLELCTEGCVFPLKGACIPSKGRPVFPLKGALYSL